MPTLEEIAMHLDLEESKNANCNHHRDEEALVLKFRKVLQQRHEGPQGGFNHKVGNNHAGSFEGLGNSSLTPGYCGCCGKYGHWAKELSKTLERGRLPTLIDEEDWGGASNEQSDPQNVAETFEAALSTMALEIRDNPWIVDFRASTHVTRNGKILNEIREPIDQYNVKTTNKQTHVVCGQGDVSFHFPSGEIKKINNVLYILGLTKNLLSIGTMTYVRFVANLIFKDVCYSRKAIHQKL
jgi:hypothetical protein